MKQTLIAIIILLIPLSALSSPDRWISSSKDVFEKYFSLEERSNIDYFGMINKASGLLDNLSEYPYSYSIFSSAYGMYWPISTQTLFPAEYRIIDYRAIFSPFRSITSYLPPTFNHYQYFGYYSDFSVLKQTHFDCKSVFSDFDYRVRLILNLVDWLGVPYRYGGRSERGIDCSNFTSLLLDRTIGLKIPAGAAYQARLFEPIRNWQELQFGDLIFFTGSNWRSRIIGHVGFYLGEGVFAHASSYLRRGVIFSHLSESNYLKRFRFGGRIRFDDIRVRPDNKLAIIRN